MSEAEEKNQIPYELTAESDDERFYKSYYNVKNSGSSAEFLHFLGTLDKDELISRKLFVPEVPETVPDVLPEEWFFGTDRKKNIVIRKHPDFTPVFYHSHEFLELFYVLEGQTNQVINGMEFLMKAGDICLIPPNVKHSISVFDSSIILNILIRQTTFEDIFINFLRSDNILSSFFLSNMYGSKASDYIIFRTKDSNDRGEKVRKTILQMYDENKRKDLFSQDMLQAELHMLFIMIVRSCAKNYDLPPNVNKENLLRFDIIRFIQDSGFDVTLEQTAGAFHLSTQYASKLIKQITGYTFTQIVLRMRMRRAKALLEDTGVPVSAVSVEIGYLNPEHFIRTFKRETGLTPGEYRRQKQS